MYEYHEAVLLLTCMSAFRIGQLNHMRRGMLEPPGSMSMLKRFEQVLASHRNAGRTTKQCRLGRRVVKPVKREN